MTANPRLYTLEMSGYPVKSSKWGYPMKHLYLSSKITWIIVMMIGLLSGAPQPSLFALRPTKPEVHVIFDLGGVLMDTSHRDLMKDFGGYIKSIKDFMAYRLTVGSTNDIKKKLYLVLNRIQETGNFQGAKDHEGDLLPGLMVDWMTGRKNTNALRGTILPAIKNNKKWFKNSLEQRLVYKLARMMFNPKRFARTRIIIEKGAALVQKLVSKGYHVHILSNWDYESFIYVEKQYKDFFDLFDRIIISGTIQAMKPDIGAFNQFHDLKHHMVFFIDDQEENIHAAKKAGIVGIHLKNRDFKSVQDTIHAHLHAQTTAHASLFKIRPIFF